MSDGVIMHLLICSSSWYVTYPEIGMLCVAGTCFPAFPVCCYMKDDENQYLDELRSAATLLPTKGWFLAAYLS